MTAQEAETKLRITLDEIYADGFDIWGWDGSIQVYRYLQESDEGFEVGPMEHKR